MLNARWRWAAAAGTFLAVGGAGSVDAQALPGETSPPAPVTVPGGADKPPAGPSQSIIGLWKRFTGGLRPAAHDVRAEPERLAAPPTTAVPAPAVQPAHGAENVPLPAAPACGGASPPSFWGCCTHSLKEHFLRCWAEPKPAPLGQAAPQTVKVQEAEGEAAHMVLYHHDFVPSGSALTPRGKDELARIAAMLPQNFFPIVIERTPDNPGLAEARRSTVLQALAGGPFPVPPQRVVIGPPLAIPLRGGEAVIVPDNIPRQAPAQGVVPGPAGGIAGGTGGTGAGATSRVPVAAAPVGPEPKEETPLMAVSWRTCTPLPQ